MATIKSEVAHVNAEMAEEWLKRNTDNRPLRPSLARNYRDELLRNKWRVNGEPIIFASDQTLLDGQHRLQAIVMAETTRKAQPKYYREKYGVRGQIAVDMVVVHGVDHKFADTIDIGQKRTAGDVLYRRQEFDADKYDDKEVKRLAKDLAVSARLVWMRMGGKKVSDAPKFPHSEMIEFIEEHPQLRDATEFVYAQDDDKAVSAMISRGYLSGLLFLFGFSDGEGKIWDKAEEFVLAFAQGTGLKKDDPAYALRERLNRERAKPSPPSRDQIISWCVKAWNAFIDGEKMSLAKLVLKKLEVPRCGGYDVEIIDEVEEEFDEDDVFEPDEDTLEDEEGPTRSMP